MSDHAVTPPPPPPHTAAAAAMHPLPVAHIPFSSVKPPFVPPVDYQRFAAELARAPDLGADAVVVRSPVSS